MEKKQDNLMEISDLTVRYNTDDAVVHAVNNFNLKLVRGEARGLVGETGAGKPPWRCPSCGCCRNGWVR